jgi:ABC-2 type transport system ATP-binding protein
VVIELSSVTKRYGAITALHDVSLRVAPGEFFALLGPNGAGKTTIIRILLDFTRPDSGSVRINGTLSHHHTARKGVGYLPENLRLPSYCSGRTFLMRQAGLCGMAGSQAKGAVDRLLDLVGMSDRARQASRSYSKGMLQRIGLAGALIGSPRLLILDEPTTGLDPLGIRDFRTIIERLRPDGVTVLLNSHHLSEVEKICSSAAIINRGTIVKCDRVEALVREGESLEDLFVRTVGAFTAH